MKRATVKSVREWGGWVVEDAAHRGCGVGRGGGERDHWVTRWPLCQRMEGTDVSCNWNDKLATSAPSPPGCLDRHPPAWLLGCLPPWLPRHLPAVSPPVPRGVRAVPGCLFPPPPPGHGGRTLRSHGRPRPACPWGPLSVAGERRSQPGRGAPAPRGAGKPPERSQARGGLLGQVTGLRAARGSPDPRARHRHRGHLRREDRMARQPGQLGAPPEGAVGVRAHSGGRGACAHWWSRPGTEAAPPTRVSGCGSEGARRARARGGGKGGAKGRGDAEGLRWASQAKRLGRAEVAGRGRGRPSGRGRWPCVHPSIVAAGPATS